MLSALFLAMVLQGPVATSTQQVLPAGTRYDSKIPRLKDVVGHDFGTEITSPEGIAAYVRALTASAPARAALVEYARSWEGRPLHVLVIGAPERMGQLDRIKSGIRQLADPRTLSASEADRLIKELPVVTCLMYAVHGNEISGPDAALALAYHLLAAQGDATVDTILSQSIVLIDPLENPDGRARFVYQTLLGRAAQPDPEPRSAEHDEPWPGGRSNHYLFDMNRDWFAQTQPETRGRTRLYLDWFPQVVVDLHEMGGDSSYYFAPPADPLNPHITEGQTALFELIGRANARRFDEKGFAYFNREVFDSFYPGYGESWPIFQGAVGMTYETASARGLAYRRKDGATLTFAEGVIRHFTTSLTTAEVAAQNRERFLRQFLNYRQGAVKEGEQGRIRAYLMPPGQDPARTERLVRLLTAQGIEVSKTEESLKVGDRTLPVGTYVINTAQPAGRLLRNLMDPNTPQPEEFVKEQDRRRKKRLPDQIYDITAWSLPLAYDVEVVVAHEPVTVRLTSALSSPPAAAETLAPAKVGYLIPWGSEAAEAAVAALREGIRVRTTDEPFTLGGRRYPVGTAIVRSSDNGAELSARLGAIVARCGVEAVPVDSGYVDKGISLGSDEVVPLKSPRVLLAWDSPTQSTSAGWARYTLERRYGQPVTAVRVQSLSRLDLNRFDVFVLPAGDYTASLSAEALKRMKDWVSAGGTLITLGEASRWAARENVALLATRTEFRDGRSESPAPEKDQKKEEPPPKPIDLEKAIQPERERPELTPGAMLHVELDTEHWLAAGTDGEIQAIVEGQRVFTPIRLDQGRNVGVYAGKDRLVAGGLVWNDAQDLLASKAYLIDQPLGQGHIVAFAEDPNYRAFTEATQLLFMNAVLLGPAH
jgi:hypothetical protein